MARGQFQGDLGEARDPVSVDRFRSSHQAFCDSALGVDTDE